jgi:hypothetical protein
MLKLTVPLPEFCAAKAEGESDAQFMAKVELEAENILGRYTRAEHDACVRSLPNGGCLNRVFEIVGIAYAPCPQPGMEASVEAAKKRKVDAYRKTAGKRCPPRRSPPPHPPQWPRWRRRVEGSERRILEFISTGKWYSPPPLTEQDHLLLHLGGWWQDSASTPSLSCGSSLGESGRGSREAGRKKRGSSVGELEVREDGGRRKERWREILENSKRRGRNVRMRWRWWDERRPSKRIRWPQAILMTSQLIKGVQKSIQRARNSC